MDTWTIFGSLEQCSNWCFPVCIQILLKFLSSGTYSSNIRALKCSENPFEQANIRTQCAYTRTQCAYIRAEHSAHTFESNTVRIHSSEHQAALLSDENHQPTKNSAGLTQVTTIQVTVHFSELTHVLPRTWLPACAFLYPNFTTIFERVRVVHSLILTNNISFIKIHTNRGDRKVSRKLRLSCHILCWRVASQRVLISENAQRAKSFVRWSVVSGQLPWRLLFRFDSHGHNSTWWSRSFAMKFRLVNSLKVSH